MPSPAEGFLAHRPRLFGLAYRMLGSRADAEDVLQDAYLRWQTARRDELESPEAWLVTVVTRLSIDRLRSAKVEREAYTGPWLPEPLVAPDPEVPERSLELADDISQAFLVMLEHLAPEERAVFLLREVFDADYPEVAQMLGKSESACRQMLHRAKERVHQQRPRFQVNPEAHKRLLARFAVAAASGDQEALRRLFAEDVSFTADGGGKVKSTTKPIQGAGRVMRLFWAINRRLGGHLSYREATINGQPGLLRFYDGALDATMSFVTDGERILDVYLVRNPDKLQHIHVA